MKKTIEWIKLIIAIIVVISARILYEMNVINSSIALIVTLLTFGVFYYRQILKLIKKIIS